MRRKLQQHYSDTHPLPHRNAKSHLTTLPPEIHLEIFDLFQHDQSSAACLGLTCKTFYPLFRALHARVPLVRFCWPMGSEVVVDGLLLDLISGWMPRHLKYSFRDNKFVTRARWLELEAKAEAERRTRITRRTRRFLRLIW